jgi:hypothetical protein
MTRLFALLLAAFGLASGTSAPETTTRSADGQRAYEALTAGKTPAAPISCMPKYNERGMTIIDARTVAYHLGSRTTYLMHLSEGCELLTGGAFTLVTRQISVDGACRGDIARVVDLPNGTTVGSCAIDQIVPYNKPG